LANAQLANAQLANVHLAKAIKGRSTGRNATALPAC
jgi:hypothetical protein